MTVIWLKPPYTSEIYPIENIRKEIRARGFHNEIIQTLDKVLNGYVILFVILMLKRFEI